MIPVQPQVAIQPQIPTQSDPVQPQIQSQPLDNHYAPLTPGGTTRGVSGFNDTPGNKGSVSRGIVISPSGQTVIADSKPLINDPNALRPTNFVDIAGNKGTFGPRNSANFRPPTPPKEIDFYNNDENQQEIDFYNNDNKSGNVIIYCITLIIIRIHSATNYSFEST